MIKLATNRLILAVLCVIIGMAPFIALVNTVQSGKHMLDSKLIGEDDILINVDLDGSNATYTDLLELSEAMDEIKTIIPISTETTSLKSYRSEVSVSVKAVSEDFSNYAGLDITRGKFLTAEHRSNSLNVIVIDDLTADLLYGTTEVLGKSIELTLNGMEFEATIIGVCKRLDNSENQLIKEQAFAYVPITMLENNFAHFNLQKSLLLVTDNQIDEAKANIIHFLEGRDVFLSVEDITRIEQVALIDAFVEKNKELIGVMAILWLIAIVGLANILLLDVEQNKKYYGLLKFYGRDQGSIRNQVYLKAYYIALLCGAFGIAFGLGVSFAVCYVLNIPLHVSIYSIALGMLSPILLCMLAAIYPAYRASAIDVNKNVWEMD